MDIGRPSPMLSELAGDTLILQVNSETRAANVAAASGRAVPIEGNGKVTLGVVARNSAPGVARLFQSIKDQDASFELLLIDNASDENESAQLEELCAAASFPALYLRREQNSLAGARNDILWASDSEFLVYLDSDVEIPAGWLRSALKILRENPRTAGVSGPGRIPADMSVWARLLQALNGSYLMNLGSPQCVDAALSRMPDHLPGSAVAFRRAELETVKGFDEEFVGGGEDLELGLRLRQAGAEFLFSDELLFLHSTRAGDLKSWLQRCFSLGRGRVHVARKHRAQFRAPALILPLAFGAFLLSLLILLLAAPVLAVAGAFYYALFLLPTALPRTGRDFPRSLVLMAGSHAAYALGEWAELIWPRRGPRKSKLSKVKAPKIKLAQPAANFEMRRDVFSHGQIVSKIRLCELMLATYGPEARVFERVYVLAGWAGLLPFLMRSKLNGLFKKIILIDQDPKACEQARILNNTLECEARFEVRVADLTRFDFTAENLGPKDLVINTSMEHFSDFKWLEQIPAGVELALQASDLPHVEHLSPAGDVASLTQILDKNGIALRTRVSDVQEINYPDMQYRRVSLVAVARGLH